MICPFVSNDKMKIQANEIKTILVYLIKYRHAFMKQWFCFKCFINKLCGEHLVT